MMIDLCFVQATSTQEKLDTARQRAPVSTEAPKEIKLEKVASARNVIIIFSSNPMFLCSLLPVHVFVFLD